MGDEEKHAASLTKDLCIEEDKTTVYEANGSTDDAISEAAKEEDATTCPTYDDMKEPTSFPMYDADDDMDSIPHPIYDKDDDTCMIVPGDDKLGVDTPEHDENLACDELPFEDDFIS